MISSSGADSGRPAAPSRASIEPSEYFRLIADSTYDWEMWQGPGGECLYVSPSCERITGHSREAFLGAPGLLDTIVHPGDREALARHQAEEAASMEPLTMEFRIVTRNGDERWISHACQSVRGPGGDWWGRRSSNRDITDRVRAEQAYRTLVDNMLQGLFVIVEGRVVFANRRAAELTGDEVEELQSWRVEDVIRRVVEDDKPLVWERFRERVAGKVAPHVYSFRFVRKDGEVRWWELHSRGVTHFGKPAIHVAFMDITERKRAEAEREEAVAALHRSEALYRRRSSELEALHEALLQLTSELDGATLLKVIIAQAVALLDVTAGGLFLYDAANDRFCLEVATDYLSGLIGMTFPGTKGLAGQALRSGRTLVLSDYQTWPDRIEAARTFPNVQHLMAAPLIGSNGPIGVLDFASEERAFGERDIWLAEMFAAQATVALENARLHAEAERRARENAALHRAGQAITAQRERETVLQLVIDEARRLLGADGAWVLLCETGSEEACTELVVVAASAGRERMVGARIPVAASIAGDVALNKAPEVIVDAWQDARRYRGIDAASGLTVRSLLAAPLIVRDMVLGVLEVSKESPDAFDRQDLEVFVGMARSTAIALDNANLLMAERAQFQRLQESQQQMVRVERMAALGRMAAALAHEINNPLQAIQSHLELVMDFPLPPEQQERFLGVVRSEIERLKQIVLRVLQFARPAGASRQQVAVADLVAQTLALAGKELQRHDIAVAVDVDGDLVVDVGRDQMVQVFLNLVINAIEAIGRSGHIWVRAWQEEGMALVTFANDGRPIADSDLPHVFDPFFTTKIDGTGLGLSVSQNLVEQYGGRLTVENDRGGKRDRGTGDRDTRWEGVVFTVRLPQATGQEEES